MIISNKVIPQVDYEFIVNKPYKEVWDYQHFLLSKVIESKKKIKEGSKETINHHLLFCEHFPVYTLGKSGSIDHLLLSERDLEVKKIEFFKINRGGDITFHGPGQITGYPIFDLECFFTDVHKYVNTLEQIIIDTIADYGIQGYRIKEYTGVWVKDKDMVQKKICAIGVHLSRWVTMHGFAFNVNTDLSYFKHIIPCGINDEDKNVTSLSELLGYPIDLNEIILKLKANFAKHFACQYKG